MRVLVYEPDHIGHHFSFVSLLLPAVAALGPETVFVTSEEAPGTEQYRQLIRPLEGLVRVDASCPAPGRSLWGNASDRAAHLLQSVRRHGADHVMVPYADGIAQVLALRRLTGRRMFPRGVMSDALLLRGAFAYPAGSLKRRLFTAAVGALTRRAPFTYLHHLDPLVYERLPPGQWSLMPDPVGPSAPLAREEARRLLGIPQDGRYIGCVGLMDSRKGVDLLLTAFSRADLAATDRLLLVGPQDEAVRELLAGPFAGLLNARRVIAIDRFVPQADLVASVFAMDVVCTPYPAHIGSASIVIRAAAAGRPVLGSTFGWVGRTITMFGLGRTCQVRDPAALADNIRAGLDEAPRWRSAPVVDRFVRFHSPENFAKAWCVGLRRRLGLPPEPGALTWEWVLEALPSRTGRSRADRAGQGNDPRRVPE